MPGPSVDPLAPALPPTMDELPYDDGTPMESEKHRKQMDLLCETAESWFRDRPDVYVAGNMALYYSVLQAKNQDFKAPDVFVVREAIPNRVRKSWVMWEEDGRAPDVVIELLSPSTEAEDRGRKMRVYRGLHVTEYFLFDPDSNRLEGYRLDSTGTRYQPIAPLADGDLVCAALGLRLGVVRGVYRRVDEQWLRWKAPDGAVVPTEEERAETERAQAEAERERAERLAAKLRAMGVDPEG